MNTNMDLELLDFWFGFMRDKWFGCSEQVDDLITTKYKNWLDLAFNNSTMPSQDKIILSRIILFDQIPRHIYRSENKDKPNDSIDRKELMDSYGAKAREMLEKSGLIDRLETLDPESRCFALLPWRHTFDPVYLTKCVGLVSAWREAQPSQPMYRRFYQATIKALSTIYNDQDLRYYVDPTNSTDLATILDPGSTKNILGLTIKLIESIPESNYLVQEFKSKILGTRTNELIVSLSGGVDSMVCLVLAKRCFPDFVIKAISIDYANRPEQSLEIEMCGLVCSSLDIPHYVRRIGEIKRTRDLDREFYETITREIRFGCYAKLTRELDSIPVILGHNQDDCVENIFSNIKKRKNYANLFGMGVQGLEKGIKISRPLLSVPKSSIIKFAHEFNIPYTYDSTPGWCERGRLRDKLIPEIKSFDPTIIPGLIELVKNYTQIYSVYANSIPKISYRSKFCTIDCSAQVYILDYWKKIFTQIASHYSIPFAKTKSLIHLTRELESNNRSRITVSKNMIAQLNLITKELVVWLNC